MSNKKQNWSTFRVEVWEHDRWSGKDLLERREFETKTEALSFCQQINGKNTAQYAPDYYVTAELLD